MLVLTSMKKGPSLALAMKNVPSGLSFFSIVTVAVVCKIDIFED